MMAALAWAFGGKDAVIFPLPPLGTVVTKEVLAAVRAEIWFGKFNVSEAILQHEPVCRLYGRQKGFDCPRECCSQEGRWGKKEDEASYNLGCEAGVLPSLWGYGRTS